MSATTSSTTKALPTAFNALLTLCPQASTYQSPLAAHFLVYKDVTSKAGWNYYRYNEGSFVGPTASRYFHANETTLALKHAFLNITSTALRIIRNRDRLRCALSGESSTRF